MPQRGVGYVLADCVQWRREKDKADARASTAPDIAAEQARKMKADADLSELKVQQMRGDLVPSIDVVREMDRLCAVLRARVLSIRGRWAPKILGLATMAEAATVLDRLSADVLEALREGADELEEEEPAEEEAA
jgi:hypothetical protein